MMRPVLLSAALGSAAAGPLADRWLGFVTANFSKRTVWSNTEQLAREAQQEDLPANQTHPFALQTRFPMDAHISSGASGERYVAIEMGGGKADCLPDCEVVLFGLSDQDDENVLLKSYKSEKLKSAVKVLQDDPAHEGAVLDFTDLEWKGYAITYRWFAANASFFGAGGGELESGGRLDVFETIAEDLVAPLELFYGADGTLYTDYVTPLEYHQGDAPAPPAPCLKVDEKAACEAREDCHFCEPTSTFPGCWELEYTCDLRDIVA